MRRRHSYRRALHLAWDAAFSAPTSAPATTPEHHFESLGSFVRAVRALPGGDDLAYIDNDRRKWFGGVVGENAFRLAERGWPEGMRQASELATRIVDRVVAHTQTAQDFTVGYDVMGAAYDAGAYNLGVPECWGVMAPQESKRAVWVVSNLAVSSGVPPEVMMRRGVAVAALAMALTAQGYPVTLTLVEGLTNGVNGQHFTAVDILNAATGSQVDMDRVVYALAHPSMYRYLFRSFGNQHRSNGGENPWGSTMPNDVNAPRIQGADLYLGAAHLAQVERWVDGGESWILAEYQRQTTGGAA